MYIILLGSYTGQAMGHTQEKICSISEVERGGEIADIWVPPAARLLQPTTRVQQTTNTQS